MATDLNISRSRRAAAGAVFLLGSELLCPGGAIAESGLTGEEETIFWGLVGVTVGSAILSAAAALFHFWKSKRDELEIVRHSALSVLGVSFGCFYAALIPLLHRLDFIDAFIVLYIPALISGVVVIAAGLWVRMLLASRFNLKHSVVELQHRMKKLRRTAQRRQRDRRIERALRAREKRLGVQHVNRLRSSGVRRSFEEIEDEGHPMMPSEE